MFKIPELVNELETHGVLSVNFPKPGSGSDFRHTLTQCSHECGWRRVVVSFSALKRA